MIFNTLPCNCPEKEVIMKTQAVAFVEWEIFRRGKCTGGFSETSKVDKIFDRLAEGVLKKSFTK